MHAVVNHLEFTDPVDPELWRRVENEVGGQIRSFAGFHGFKVVHTSDRHAILVIFADTGQTLDDIAAQVGNTWMGANVAPLLSRPPDRHLGEVVASMDAVDHGVA